MDRAVEALLIIGAAVVLGLLALAVFLDRPRVKRPKHRRLWAEAETLAAHAAAAQARAGQAAAIAYATRQELIAAERDRAAAWAAQDTTDRAYGDAWQAALAGRQAAAAVANGAANGAANGDCNGDCNDAGNGDGVDRERAVSRAALSACQRGDISVPELREVWRRAGDWDPAQDERERLVDHYRTRQAAARRVCDRAAAAVRRANQAARLAEVAAQALIDEAVDAAVEAHQALLTAQRRAPRRVPRRWRRPSR